MPTVANGPEQPLAGKPNAAMQLHRTSHSTHRAAFSKNEGKVADKAAIPVVGDNDGGQPAAVIDMGDAPIKRRVYNIFGPSHQKRPLTEPGGLRPKLRAASGAALLRQRHLQSRARPNPAIGYIAQRRCAASPAPTILHRAAFCACG
ncbi:hypothetical protein [Pelagimonas varians]|uniref:hypothetical protein n=1 Tax=Pelagimonas varians TaxID=696760 RepID=UPI0011414FB7|nr:hypothetical protein [Pelagimonas varians]